jgi:hypothetical protein
MKTRFVVLSLVACSLLVPAQSPAQFNKAGRTAFQFVKIGVGARQTAIGEAGISSVRDVNAAFWNPAGISGIGRTEASFSYSTWFADMKYLSGAAGTRIEGVGVFAVSWAMLNYGDMQEALVTGVSSDTRTGNTFTGSDLLLGLSYSREFTDRLSIGVTVKYLHEKLWNYSSKVFPAFDIGTNYSTGFKGIRFGMSAQNFGSSVKFLSIGDREEGYDIPLMFRIGASIDVISSADGLADLGADHALTLSLESVNSNDYGERWHLGGEYVFGGFLSFRGGYRFNYEEGNLALGVGFARTIGDVGVRLDYSYVSFANLESPHRITLSVTY